jgi:antitoxin CptB
MPGLVPGIHVFFCRQNVDGRVRPGHDELRSYRCRTDADIRLLHRYITPRPARPGFWRLDGIQDMTGTTRSSGGLDNRRKRLLFRCWHRGTREMDLILGRFADAEITELSDPDLDELERLLDVPDPDLYAALTGDAPPPAEAGALFGRIKAFRAVEHDQ